MAWYQDPKIEWLQFPEEANAKIQEYGRTRFKRLDKVRAESFPYKKFTKGKKAKSYIQGGEKLFKETIGLLTVHGFPLTVKFDADVYMTHKALNWEEQGVSMETKGSEITFKIANPQGAVPNLVQKVKEVVEQIKKDKAEREKARESLKILTDKYIEDARALVGVAGVHSIQFPRLKFVNLDAKPDVWETSFVEEIQWYPQNVHQHCVTHSFDRTKFWKDE